MDIDAAQHCYVALLFWRYCDWRVVVVVARVVSTLLLIFSCACWMASPAFPAKRAFVIGINSYGKVPKLSRAASDGRAVATALRGQEFEVTSVQDVGKAAFQKAHTHG